MPFLNGSKRRDSGNHNHRNNRFQKHSHRNPNEKQHSGHFICNGVGENTFLIHHQSTDLVNDLDGDNRSAPGPQPFGKCQNRNQFPAAASHKRQIRQTIQYGSRFAFAFEFSSQISVRYITDATSEINGPESITLDTEKQQANGSQKTKCRYGIWQMFHQNLTQSQSSSDRNRYRNGHP